jgi:hypothetical protein
MFIFEMQFIWVWLDEILGKGLSTWDIFKLLVFASARVVNMALPLAVLMSSIMAMGALAESNELTAIKSAGVSLVRIMRPLIFTSIVISIVAFVFANNIWPVCNLKLKTYLFNLTKQRPALSLEDGVFYNGIQGISIRAGRNDMEQGILRDVLIYDHRGGERENRTVIRAESGRMQQTEDKTYMILTLKKGESYDEQKEAQGSNKKKDYHYGHVHGSFDEMTLRIDLSSLKFSGANEDQMKNPAEMMTIRQLNVAIDSLMHQRDTLHSPHMIAQQTAYQSALKNANDSLSIGALPLFDQAHACAVEGATLSMRLACVPSSRRSRLKAVAKWPPSSCMTAAVFSSGVPAGMSTTTWNSDLSSKGSILSMTKPVAGKTKDKAIKPATPKPSSLRLRPPVRVSSKGLKTFSNRGSSLALRPVWPPCESWA